MMKIDIPKPETLGLDDGLVQEALAKDLPIPLYMAQVSPPPPEITAEVKKRFMAQHEKYRGNAFAAPEDDPLEQWCEGRAALVHQLNWWEQVNNSRIVHVQDFYAPDDSLTTIFPAWIESEIQAGLIAEGLVPWLTFATEIVSASTVKATYVSSAAETRSLRQVEPGAELPRTKISVADSNIELHKYGRSIEAAYEVISEQKVDVLGHHLRSVGMQMAVDETDHAMSVLIAGDGTTAGAAETDSTDVDVGTAGAIAYSDLVSWMYDPEQPYRIDKAVGGRTDLALITNLSEFKKSKAEYGESVDPGLPDPRNSIIYRRWDGGVTGSSYVDRLIVGIDSRMALKKYTKGSLLQENDNHITRQVREWTVSYFVGWRKFEDEATHVLDVNTAL